MTILLTQTILKILPNGKTFIYLQGSAKVELNINYIQEVKQEIPKQTCLETIELIFVNWNMQL